MVVIPKTLHFYQNILILSRDPVPLNDQHALLTLREEKLEEGVLAVEHEPGEVRLQRVPVLLQEALHVVRHRAGKMFDPAKKEHI